MRGAFCEETGMARETIRNNLQFELKTMLGGQSAIVNGLVLSLSTLANFARTSCWDSLAAFFT
jgi:hypothetical protein